MLSIRPQFTHSIAVKNQPAFKGQKPSVPSQEVPDAFVSSTNVADRPDTSQVDSAIIAWAQQIQSIAQVASKNKVRITETELSKHYTKDLSEQPNPDTFAQDAIEKAHETDRNNREYLDTGFLLGMIKEHELPYAPIAYSRERARNQLQFALTDTADVIRKVVPSLHGADLLQPNAALEKLCKAFAELHKSNEHAKLHSVGLTRQEIQERLPQVEKQE